MTLNALENAYVGGLGYRKQEALSSALEQSITGVKDQSSVEKAMSLDTESSLSVNEAAQQNTNIAEQFLKTSKSAIDSAMNQVNEGLQAVTMLSNGTVPSTNKMAAAESIAAVTGMISNPTSREEQEGSVVSLLRTAGTSFMYATLSTQAGQNVDATSLPPAAVETAPSSSTDSGSTDSGSTGAADSGNTGPGLYYSPATIPDNTFALDAETPLVLNGFSADALSALDGFQLTDTATATFTIDGTGTSGEKEAHTGVFSVQLADETYTSENVSWTPGTTTNQPFNLYADGGENKDQFITVNFAADTTALDSWDATNNAYDAAIVPAAFAALFGGTFASDPSAVSQTAPNALAGGAASPNALFPDLGDTTANPVVCTNVGTGVISAHEAEYTSETDYKLSVQVGDDIYATGDTLTNLTSDSTVTLYLNGDETSESTIAIPITPTDGNFTAPDSASTLLSEFSTAFVGQIAPSAAAPEAPVQIEGLGDFTLSGAGSSQFFSDATTLSFHNVPSGDVSVITANESTGEIELQVGDLTYKAEAWPNTLTVDTAADIELFQDGDNTASSTITVHYNGVGNLAANPATGDAWTAEEYMSDVQKSLEGSLSSPWTVAVNDATDEEDAGSVSTPPSGGGLRFTMNENSNLGAGHFTVGYTAGFLSIDDQFGNRLVSYPITEESMIKAGQESGSMSVGDIGTLDLSGYKGGEFSESIQTVPTDAFRTSLTTSSTGATLAVEIPNLTDMQGLWGTSEITIDPTRLMHEVSYRSQVEGMLKHAYQSLKDARQSVDGQLDQIKYTQLSQVDTEENLRNLADTVTLADQFEVAQDVFESGQSMQRMTQAATTLAEVQAMISSSAAKIASLATA